MFFDPRLKQWDCQIIPFIQYKSFNVNRFIGFTYIIFFKVSSTNVRGVNFSGPPTMVKKQHLMRQFKERTRLIFSSFALFEMLIQKGAVRKQHLMRQFKERTRL